MATDEPTPLNAEQGDAGDAIRLQADATLLQADATPPRPDAAVAASGGSCGTAPRKPLRDENGRIRLTHLTEKGG